MVPRLIVATLAAVVIFMDSFPAWAEWVSFGILVLLFAWPIARWVRVKYCLEPTTFTIRFRTRDRTINGARSDAFVDGGRSTKEIWLKVNRPIEVSRFDLRFVRDLDGRSLEGGAITMLDATDWDVPPRYSRDNYVREEDGGLKFTFKTRLPLTPQQQIPFVLDLDVRNQAMSCYLRFRGYKEDGGECYSFLPVIVRPVTTPSASDTALLPPEPIA